MNGVEKDGAEKEFLGAVGKTANDVALERVAGGSTRVLAAASLTTAVHRRHRHALARVAELVDPIAAISGIAVEFKDGGVLASWIFWPHIFCVNPRAAHAGVCQIKRLAVRGADRLGAFQFGLGIDRIQFAERTEPVFIEVCGLRIRAGVGFEFVEWFVEAGHG